MLKVFAALLLNVLSKFIFLELFKQAYMLNTCGHSFEKEEIEKWL